jgi:oligopeptide/dipeptide ABC transporter ATP-binding protein
VVRLLCDRVLVMYGGRVMEEGPAGSLFSAPAHPYTAALAGAVTAPGKQGEAAAVPRLAGEPRSPIDPDPKACRFHGRCPVGQDVCRTVPPPLRPLADGRHVACHFPTGAAA